MNAEPRLAPVVQLRNDVRRHQRGAILLAVAALAVAGLLVPHGDELLLIHLRNHDLVSARTVLAHGASNGVSTVSSLVAHDELYLLEGNVDEAVAELEQFVEANPGNLGAWTRLARLYRNAQRFDDQANAVAHIHAIEPTTDTARQLVTFARRQGDEQLEASRLHDLIDRGGAEPGDYIRSSRLDAALGKRDVALETLERLRAADAGAFDYPALELYANLTLDVRGVSDLGSRVYSLPVAHREAAAVEELTSVFRRLGRPDAAVALFAAPARGDGPPERLALRARAATDTPLASVVVDELAAYDQRKPLPPEAVGAFVELALGVQDYDHILQVLQRPEHRVLPASTSGIAAVIGYAVSHHARDAAQRIVASLGDQSLADTPMLALDLAVERKDAVRADMWIERIAHSAQSTPDDLANVAEFEASLGFEQRAFDRLAGLIGARTAPARSFYRFAQLATHLSKQDEALHRLSVGAGASPEEARAWVMLAAARGRTDLIDPWLDSAVVDAGHADALKDAYFLLADRGDVERAVRAATTLDRVHPNAESALLLGQALVAAGQPARALEPLRRADLSRADGQAAYDRALFAALESGADVASEVRDVFTVRLRTDNPAGEHRLMLLEGLWTAGERASLFDELATAASSDMERWLGRFVEAAIAARRENAAVALVERALVASPRSEDTAPRRMTLVRALLDLDAPDAVVLPALKDLAYTAGGTWVYAYDERMARTGRTAERVELWSAVGLAAAQPIAERRAAAARLVELGAPDRGADVLQLVASDARPIDADVQQLVALWGGHPGELQVHWLTERLRSAPRGDRVEWIRHLVNAGAAAAVADIYPSLPDDASPGLALAWLDAIRASRRADLQRSAVSQVVDFVAQSDESDVPSLSHADVWRRAGSVALSEGMPDLAARAYELVLQQQPNDLEARRWAGTLAFYDHRLPAALAHLTAYAEAGGVEPEPLFQLGEIWLSLRDAGRARPYWEQALSHLAGVEHSAAADALLANVLTRLDEERRAIDTFASVLARIPENDHVRADYVSALLHWGRFSDAWTALGGDDALPAAHGRHSADATRAPSAAGDASVPAVDASGARRLDLLRVQYLNFEGRYADTLRVLDRLVAAFPGDPDVLVARASFDAARGRQADADTQYETARREAPDRSDIGELLDGRRAERAPSVTASTEQRRITDAWTSRGTSTGFAGRLRPYLPFTVQTEQLQISAPRVTLPDGRVSALSKSLRRVEARATIRAGRDTAISGSWFGDISSGIGAGIEATRHDLRGATTLRAEVNRPFWDMLESAADGGRRDQVGLQRDWRFRADMAAWVIADMNRYRLGSGAQAVSTLLNAGIIRTVRHQSPTLTLQYGLDKERVLSKSTTIAADGRAFAPIPLVSREVHLFGAVSHVTFRQFWDGDATAGYTVDRFGGHGSFLTAHLTPKPSVRVGLELWGERRLYALATTQQALRVGAGLVVRLP